MGSVRAALLFDMDGVILSGPGTHPGVYRAAAHDALREFGVDVRTRTGLSDDVGPSEIREAREALEAVRYSPPVDEACSLLGVDRDAWWRARERYASRRTNARVRSGDRPTYPDVDALSSLSADRSLALVTNNRTATAEFVATYCVPDRFDAVIGRKPTIESYRRRKPEPDFLERGVTALETEWEPESGSESGYYVGDRETDVIAARRAGLEAIVIDRPHVDVGKFTVEPDHVIDSLHRIPDVIDDD
ncbi:HAD family hydrolase [Halopenitus persicus]|uniref:HAD family hydrolase n=1 Tax=Halopenitus persicus TaxID=1048396 RepID=UPI000BBB498F|nr:HAD family hydrolase [Halopenitus persicus]